ncbi:MAG: GTPase RsgA, partial [Acidimicrobiales bacterium]
MLQPNFDPLVPYGWNERVLTLFNTHASPGDRPARVVRAERGRCVIVDAGGDETEVDSPQSPAVGEWLLMQGTSIVGALPRWSELARGDPNGSSVQVLAANVDLVAITVPADRLNAARVERELAIAWDSGAQPLVILTKADLGTPDDLVALESRLGVDVLATSAAARTGLDGVAQIL